MKRNLVILTLVVFAFSSVFLLSSCAKKQVVAEEIIVIDIYGTVLLNLCDILFDKCQKENNTSE